LDRRWPGDRQRPFFAALQAHRRFKSECLDGVLPGGQSAQPELTEIVRAGLGDEERAGADRRFPGARTLHRYGRDKRFTARVEDLSPQHRCAWKRHVQLAWWSGARHDLSDEPGPGDAKSERALRRNAHLETAVGVAQRRLGSGWLG